MNEKKGQKCASEVAEEKMQIRIAASDDIGILKEHDTHIAERELEYPACLCWEKL